MSDSPQYPSYPGDDSPATGSDEGRQPPPGQQPPPPPWGQQVPQYGQVPPQYGQVPPGYAQPPLYGYPAPQYVPTSTKAAFALPLGIVSILFCYLGVLIGPAAIIVSVLAKKEIDARPPGTMAGRGLATAGLVTGIIGTVIWGLLTMLTIIGMMVE